MSHHKKEAHNIRPYKILAQSFGMLVCGFFVLFLIGEGLPDILKGMGKSILPFLPIILLPVVGYILTWFNEKVGASVMIIGGLILFGYFIKQQDIKMALIFGIPFITAGGLFILHIFKRTTLQNKKI
jgi:predicted membrane protein